MLLKKSRQKLGKRMGRVIRVLLILVFLASIGLIGYAYVGPLFGADFSAPSQEIREPVILNAG
jgi:O-antigen/teichoic acid export membrane protein